MTVEASIYSVLSAVCPRTFADLAPVNTQRPYVTYTQIGGRVINQLDNSMPDKQNAEIQVNVWANTRKEASALIRQVEQAMRQASAFVAAPLAAPSSDYDHDMQVYGSNQDFSVWS